MLRDQTLDAYPLDSSGSSTQPRKDEGFYDDDDEAICTPECQRLIFWLWAMFCCYGWIGLLFLCVYLPLVANDLDPILRIGLSAGLGCGFFFFSVACCCCCCCMSCCKDRPSDEEQAGPVGKSRTSSTRNSLRRSALEPEQRQLEWAASALETSPWLPEIASRNLARATRRMSSSLLAVEQANSARVSSLAAASMRASTMVSQRRSSMMQGSASSQASTRRSSSSRGSVLPA